MNVSSHDTRALMDSLLPAVYEAGDAIMRIYNEGVEAQIKSDGSPVTKADEAAEKLLLGALTKVAPDITIISEENTDSHTLPAPQSFFLVDPLDGTREFIKADGKGSFTVNIAFIENGHPVMGIVYAPALKRMFTGIVGDGAQENGNNISARAPKNDKMIALASCSHKDEQTEKWLKENAIHETVSIGSSLKFCLVANGEADIYPRFSPTMEWDTAAGQAVLMAAGGSMTQLDGTTFTYGKAGYRNGGFMARGGAAQQISAFNQNRL